MNKIFTVKLNERGFSLAEVTLVLGIIAVFLSIVGFSLSRSQHSSYISTTLDTFLSDFKEQQIKAMVGDTEGGSSPDNYGIHFETNSYTLFRGIWSSGNPNNFVVNLPPTIQVSTDYVDLNGEQYIIFVKGDGHIASHNTSKTITIKDFSVNIEKTISLSYWGATTVN